MGKDGTVKDIDKMNRYSEEQKQIQEVARGKEESSETHLKMHNSVAKCVTLFQIAIAICAISAIARRKWLWFASIALGIGGIIMLIMAHL